MVLNCDLDSRYSGGHTTLVEIDLIKTNIVSIIYNGSAFFI